MPRQKTPKGAGSAQEAVTDPRFSSFSTDPRFRLPSKKNARTKIDKRFSRMLEDDDISNTAKVDRYGRKLSSGGKKKALERLYQPEEPEDEDEDEDEDDAGIQVEDDEIVAEELKKADAGYDAARGGGFSSSSEDDEDEDEEEEEVEVTEFPDLQTEQAGVPLGEVSSRIAIVNLDWDNIRALDLMAVMSSFVRPGGKVKKISVYQSEFGKERMEREQMEGPPREIFQKKAPEVEEEESDSEADSEDDSQDEEELEEQIKKELLQEDDGKEYDNAALRQYQLERLRYYYGVMECSDEDTARNIYEATDGTEYLSSANFFDLRFIPDGTEFDDQPRDECDSVPQGYKPTDFVTDALRQSKVKLTWDAEDSTRKDVIKKAFSGSRAEIGENDLRAYLGSDTSDSEEEEEETPIIESSDAPKLSKKELARQKMREALGLPVEPEKKSSKTAKSAGPVGDMQITFTAGLSSSKESGGSIFTNEPIRDETTAEAYVRREKERKARRREKAKAIREGRDPDLDAPDKEAGEGAEDGNANVEATADLGFDDPFFAADESAKDAATKAARKESRRQRRIAREADDAATSSVRAELELLMADNSTDAPSHLDHFDINEIARAEKLKKKGKKGKLNSKGKGAKGKMAKEMEMAEDGGKKGGLQEGFEMDVQDERFKAVFERHEFAIDPSHPRYGGTEGMKKLLEEGRRKRKDGSGLNDGEEEVSEKKSKKQKRGSDAGGSKKGGELQSLVQTLKKKSKH